jgi:hypothetical protein
MSSADNTSNCGTAAFPVTKGWDPVTGFGTPVCIFLFDQHAIANEFDRFSQSWWRLQSSVRFL